MWALAWIAAAWAGSPGKPPPPLEVSAAEAARLSAGEVVVRPATDGVTIAIADSKATPRRLIDAALDIEAREGEVSAISDVTVYLNQPDAVGARFTITVLGSDTVFHTLYDADRDGGYATYHLDKSRENDLARSDGSYQAYPLGDGRTRLVFRVVADNGGWVPVWVKEKLTAGPLVDQVNGIRRRAER